ncbi:hypothetical protein AB0758_30710 [Tolypothrix bouteillei VB521301_2]
MIVAGDDVTANKPESQGLLLAVKRLNQMYLDLKHTQKNVWQ